jgi:hypothetical protein
MSCRSELRVHAQPGVDERVNAVLVLEILRGGKAEVKMRILVLFVLLLIPSLATAQDTRPAVAVSHSGDDQVGRQLAYAIRERLGRSTLYRLIESRQSPAFTISLVTLDDSVNGQGLASGVSVAYLVRNDLPFVSGNPQTWYELLLEHTLHTVGRSRVELAANNIIANLDRSIADYRRDGGTTR